MRFKEIITESQDTLLNQFTKDLTSGLIHPKVTAAIISYVAKKMAGFTNAIKAAEKPAEKLAAEPAEPKKLAPQVPTAVTPVAPVTRVDTSLTNKVTEATNTTVKPAVQLPNLDPKHLTEFLKKGGFSDSDIADIVFFAYKETTAQNCKAIAAKKYFKSEAADILLNMFLKCPGDFHHRTEISRILLDGGGVLNLEKFSGPGKGIFDDFIMKKYRTDPVVQSLKHQLMNRKDLPTQTSAASKGVGEDLICILGDPVQKLSPGDLNINGREIEVKAIGARLKGFSGVDVYGNAAAIYGEWANLVNKALGKDGIAMMAQSGANLTKYMHFSKSNLEALAKGFAASKVKDKSQIMKEAFDLMLGTLYVQSTVSMRNIVLNCFNKDSFDPEVLRQQWMLLNYDYYKLTTKDKTTGTQLEGIMFFNQTDERWVIITDKSQLVKQINEFTIGSDLFNWTNPNGQAPKITYGKETREKTAGAKERQKSRYAAKKASRKA